MAICAQCGYENSEGSRFCVKCGASMEAPAQAAPPVQQPEAPPAAAAPPPPTPPPPAAPPPAQPYVPPAQPAYQQPVSYPQAQPSYPPQAAYPAYAQAPARAAKSRGGLFWAGALLVLVAGVLILVSTWMAWGSGPRGVLSLSGWDWFDIGKAGGGESGEVVNAFFVYSGGYPVFTGLCSLILGGLIALLAVLMLLFRSKGMGGIAILFSIFALGMAITNLTTILRTEGISVGSGMYLVLVVSFLGIVGGGMAVSG